MFEVCGAELIRKIHICHVAKRAGYMDFSIVGTLFIIDPSQIK